MKPLKKFGKVYLVGAGPGDPGLITVKGRTCLQQADVIVFDHLVDPSLWKSFTPQAKLIDAGKMRGAHKLTQEKISRLLVREAKKGKIVVRLKGGDPVIFGRAGEEAEELYKAKIPFEIIPGISSINAVTTYAGIPLTHRDLTRDIAILTGHDNPNIETIEKKRVHWQGIAQMGTIVILMGSKYLKENLQTLISFGRAESTPAAAIEWGTYPRQKTIVGTLSTLSQRVSEAKMGHPMVVVVGEVVKLRESLNWFESRPLFGKRIVVTRARSQASVLVEKLKNLGADVFECPTIEIVPPKSWKELDRAIQNLKSYSCIVFTSINAVEYTMQRLQKIGLDSRAFAKIKIASIGDATSEKIRQYGLEPDIEPKSSQGKFLAAAILKAKLKGTVLFPQSKIGGLDLVRILVAGKLKVDRVVAYENRLPAHAKEIVKQLDLFHPEWLTFASSSSVENFVQLVDKNIAQYQLCKIAVIGPVTAATAQKFGFTIAAESPKADIQKMIEAIVRAEN